MKIVEMVVKLADTVPDSMNIDVRSLSGRMLNAAYVWPRAVDTSGNKWGYCTLIFFVDDSPRDLITYKGYGLWGVTFVGSGGTVPYGGNIHTTDYIGNMRAEDGTLWHVVRMVQ